MKKCLVLLDGLAFLDFDKSTYAGPLGLRVPLDWDCSFLECGIGSLLKDIG